MVIRSKIADEQTSSLGGWLFADLFLLIMVIGLAGFNKIDKRVIPPSSTTTTIVCTNALRFTSTPFTGSSSYSNSSARNKLSNEVRSWIQKEGFTNPKIVVAIVRGGSKSTNKVGQESARRFWDNTVKSVLPEYVDRRTSDQPFGNTTLREGLFQLQLFFVEVAKEC